MEVDAGLLAVRGVRVDEDDEQVRLCCWWR